MSLQSIEAALVVAAAKIKPGQAHYPSLFEEDGVTPKFNLPVWLIDPVRQEIEQTPELLALSQRWLQCAGSGQRLDPWNVARALLYRLFAGAQPAQVVADIAQFAKMETCAICICIGLYGGGLSSQFELGEGVTVMPAAAVPASFERELLFGIDRWGRPIPDRRGLPRWRPSVALLISEQAEIFSEGMGRTNLISASKKAERAVRALSLAGGHAHVRSWQTAWISHPAVGYEGFGGYSASGRFDAPPHPRQGNPVEPELARAMYSKLAFLKPKVAYPVELATDRLQRSRIHPPSADALLDLGIATEIILLHDTGNESELSYRFALRGAYLLATNGSDRLAKFESFRALYRARSQAAHTGTLKPGLLARLPEFDTLCAASIRAIVEAQGFPNWNDLTLGVKEGAQSGIVDC
jgi:hypothetical protein